MNLRSLCSPVSSAGKPHIISPMFRQHVLEATKGSREALLLWPLVAFIRRGQETRVGNHVRADAR